MMLQISLLYSFIFPDDDAPNLVWETLYEREEYILQHTHTYSCAQMFTYMDVNHGHEWHGNIDLSMIIFLWQNACTTYIFIRKKKTRVWCASFNLFQVF